MLPFPFRAIGFALMCAVPGALRAQTPPARPDSSARADSIARADSALLERELGRIRAERRPIGPDTSRDVRPADSTARTRQRSPRLRYDLVLATGTPYAEDDGGVTVRPGVALGAALGAAWSTGARYSTSLGVRATTNRAVIAEQESRRSGGTVLQLDITGSIERSLFDRYALRFGAGAAWLRGSSDIVPFRYGNNWRLQPTGEAGGTMQLASARPLFATVTAQSTRFGSATLDDPVREPGWLNRVLIGLRYGR